MIPIRSQTTFYKLSWAWAWACMSQSILSTLHFARSSAHFQAR